MVAGGEGEMGGGGGEIANEAELRQTILSHGRKWVGVVEYIHCREMLGRIALTEIWPAGPEVYQYYCYCFIIILPVVVVVVVVVGRCPLKLAFPRRREQDRRISTRART